MLNYRHSSGRIQDNAEFVGAIVTGQSRFLTLDLIDQTVRVDGDVALVRQILRAKIADCGKRCKVKMASCWRGEKIRGYLETPGPPGLFSA